MKYLRGRGDQTTSNTEARKYTTVRVQISSYNTGLHSQQLLRTIILTKSGKFSPKTMNSRK